jgi:hypothetical protein
MRIKLLTNLAVQRPGFSKTLLAHVRALSDEKKQSVDGDKKKSDEELATTEQNKPAVVKKKMRLTILNADEFIAKKVEEKVRSIKFAEKLLDKYSGKAEEDEDYRRGEERKGPFKNYHTTEERDKKQIMYHERYFDEVGKNKNREDFMVGINIRVVDI